MSFIRVSANLLTESMKQGPCYANGDSNGNSYPGGVSIFGYNSTYGFVPYLTVYKGTMPTAADLQAHNNQASTFRTTDALITFQPMGWAVDYRDEVVTSNSETYIRWLVMKTASASATGTAGWFMWYRTNGNAINYLNDRGVAFAGDITGPGGGGALEMDNINIVSGRSYQLKNYSFSSARTWVFT